MHNRKTLFSFLAVAIVFVTLFALSTARAPLVHAQTTATPTNTLTPTNTPTTTPTAVSTLFPMVQGNGLVSTFTCNTGRYPTPAPGDCIQLRTGSIHAYDSNGNLTFSVDGATGNLSIAGSFTRGGFTTNKCAQFAQTFTGAATVVPATLTAAGITTPQPALLTFAQGPSQNNALLSSTTSGGVTTINAWQAITGATITPQAATTPVVVQVTVCGQ